MLICLQFDELFQSKILNTLGFSWKSFTTCQKISRNKRQIIMLNFRENWNNSFAYLISRKIPSNIFLRLISAVFTDQWSTVFAVFSPLRYEKRVSNRGENRVETKSISIFKKLKVLKSTKVVKKIRKITEKYSNNFWENTEVTFNLTDRISEF